ncbi:MAG TPA: neutral zinc metallopeptidase [Nocardioides sp.]|uniref:KPN_02809 family neutral zinc metallopeptidase n=1 Tax=Nocardioides sp. TaxID=35761 RepID=UPI002CFCEB05|nr:neutral zinc metallopeptidase [Nocardioides sp.]HQR25666.1 neutral zinc metallopeptidase [Nocardioides sp.]
MRFNPKARLDTGRVRDSGRGGGGGGSMGLPIPGGKMAGGGAGAVIMLLLFLVLAMCGGIDLGGGGGTGSGGAFDTSRMAESDTNRYENCQTGADAQSDPDCARVAVENSLYDYWSGALGGDFRPATMQTFTGSVSTACGAATSQVGPFYCPADQVIYLDTSFFAQVLEGQLGGPGGDFVEPYVIGHEYGHHIQNLLGTMGRVRTQQGPRSDAVRLELQADCYAGLWTRSATTTQDADGNVLISELTEQDIRQAIAAAAAVGDDRIQQKTQGQVTEETWTHGSAESRVRWFRTGYESGSLKACDTWAVDTP